MGYAIAAIVVMVIAGGLFVMGRLSQKRLYGPEGHKRYPDVYVLAMHDRVKKHLKKYGFEGLTQAEKYCWSAIWLWRLVQLGGFANYYGEEAADYALEAAEGFEAIGAKKFADIVRRANSMFEGGKPGRIAELRREQIGQMGDGGEAELDELGEEFVNCEENVDVLMAEYIAAHREEFLRP